jgi:hypothetical protein
MNSWRILLKIFKQIKWCLRKNRKNINKIYLQKQNNYKKLNIRPIFKKINYKINLKCRNNK